MALPAKLVLFHITTHLQLIRIEAMRVFEGYVREKWDKGGRQTSNLSKSEQRGLGSLKKRTEEGEIVVIGVQPGVHRSMFRR